MGFSQSGIDPNAIVGEVGFGPSGVGPSGFGLNGCGLNGFDKVAINQKMLHWAIPFEFHTPPVEDLRNLSHRGNVNSK